MKRPLTIAATAILAMLILYACASTIRTGTTSFVTVTIGGPANTVVLKAEAATPWARLKDYLAAAKWMSEAYAYIPSIVQVLTVTVTAPDIATPIVGVSSVSSTQTTATLRLEVPNGTGRNFLVEGWRALPGGTTQLFYSGTVGPLDLSGTDVSLPVVMAMVGPGILVSAQSPSAIDTTGCGTSTQPCRSISFALSQTTGTDAVIVNPGTYTPVGAGGSESFPLQLKPLTALLCTGTVSAPSVIDLQTLATTAIYGNDGASIDNCLIRVSAPAGGGRAMNDAIGGSPTQQSRLRVNGVSIELSGSPTGLANVGVLFNYDSLLLESTITGSAASGSVFGVQVNAGKPNIIGSTISNLPRGIDLATGANDALIESNNIDLNLYGIWVATPNKPQIRLNNISSGSTGIYVSAGSPVITSNHINNNSIGLDVEFSAGSPVIQSNSLYCNLIADLFTNMSTVLDIRGNAWDHDLTTSPSGTFGPTDMTSNNGAFGCINGVDVCYQDTSPQPNYTSILPAVPNGCLLPN